MILISEAIDIVRWETPQLAAEPVALVDSVGRILAEDIAADTDLPPFDRSQMDGFAVRAEDTSNAPVKLKIVGESAAGRGWHHEMKPGEAVRIMTGAPVPAGCNAVQKVELTSEDSDFVTIHEAVEKGRSIVRKGSEMRNGETVFKTGEIVTENMIAPLAAFGYANVKVGKRPRVAILTTGSEVIELSQKPGRDQIRNSNSVMIDVFCRRLGAETTVFPIAID